MTSSPAWRDSVSEYLIQDTRAFARMIRHRCSDLRNRWGNTRPTAEGPQPGQNNEGDGKTDTKKQH